MSRIVKLLNNETIEIVEYSKANACFQTNKYPNDELFCVIREQFNPFDMFQEKLSLEKEIERLNNIIDTMLEFSFFKEECPLNFGFGDKKEEKAQDVFYEDDYCEQNCNDIYKKCWLKYFEKLQELKEENK